MVILNSAHVQSSESVANRLIGIDEDSRRRHAYIVGSTGAGKSTLLLNLIHQDMLAGRGLTVIDVHGDLAEAVVRLVPRHRTNDAIVFEAASEHVIPFNPLACPDPIRVDQVTSGVVSAFKKLYDSWGPRLENLLRYAVFATVEQNGTLLDMLHLLTDKAFASTSCCGSRTTWCVRSGPTSLQAGIRSTAPRPCRRSPTSSCPFSRADSCGRSRPAPTSIRSTCAE
jgi:hypothetical protein